MIYSIVIHKKIMSLSVLLGIDTDRVHIII